MEGINAFTAMRGAFQSSPMEEYYRWKMEKEKADRAQQEAIIKAQWERDHPGQAYPGPIAAAVPPTPKVTSGMPSPTAQTPTPGSLPTSGTFGSTMADWQARGGPVLQRRNRVRAFQAGGTEPDVPPQGPWSAEEASRQEEARQAALEQIRRRRGAALDIGSPMIGAATTEPTTIDSPDIYYPEDKSETSSRLGRAIGPAVRWAKRNILPLELSMSDEERQRLLALGDEYRALSPGLLEQTTPGEYLNAKRRMKQIVGESQAIVESAAKRKGVPVPPSIYDRIDQLVENIDQPRAQERPGTPDQQGVSPPTPPQQAPQQPPRPPPSGEPVPPEMTGSESEIYGRGPSFPTPPPPAFPGRSGPRVDLPPGANLGPPPVPQARQQPAPGPPPGPAQGDGGRPTPGGYGGGAPASPPLVPLPPPAPGSIGDPRRTAAFDPTADINDPRNVHAVQPGGATDPAQMKLIESAKADFQKAVDGGVHFAQYLTHQGENHAHAKVGEQALHAGVGAVDPKTAQGIYQAWSENGKLDPGAALTRYMVYKYNALSATGHVAEANQMAFEILQRLNVEAARAGGIAIDFLQAGNLDASLAALQQAHGYTPDGLKLAVAKDKSHAVMIDEFTGQPTTRPFVITPQFILGSAMGMRSGRGMWNALAIRAQQMAGHGKTADKDAEGRALRNELTRERIRVLRARGAGGGRGRGGKTLTDAEAEAQRRMNYLHSGKIEPPPAQDETPRYERDVALEDAMSGENAEREA
jgi:hypothetical protein